MTDLPEHQPGQPRPHRTIDRTISATCQTHGAQGFCNLRVTKTGDGIVLNPHVADACVITIDGAGTAELRDLLISSSQSSAASRISRRADAEERAQVWQRGSSAI